MAHAYKYHPQYTQNQIGVPGGVGEIEKTCLDCHHSLENNVHGFDQNDGYLDDNNRLVHRGRCTYCRICNPWIFKKENASDTSKRAKD